MVNQYQALVLVIDDYHPPSSSLIILTLTINDGHGPLVVHDSHGESVMACYPLRFTTCLKHHPISTMRWLLYEFNE